APQLGYFGYAGDGEHVSAGAHVYVAVGGGLVHVLEGALHDALQLLVDFVLGPVVALDILRPLEIGYGHAAGVRQNVGEDHDALLEQDMVGLGRGRAVGGLGDHLGLNATGVAAGDHTLQRGGHQDVALDLQ